jgi:hypothetical protein
MTKKVQINKDLLSYELSHKGDWFIKASVHQDKTVLLVCMNVFNQDFVMQYCNGHTEAIDFIQMLLFRGFTQQ